MRWPYWTGLWAAVIGMLCLIATGKPKPLPPLTAEYCALGPDFPCPDIPMTCKPNAEGGQTCTGRIVIGQEEL